MVRAEADRDRLTAGVQPVVADFDDPASIAAALHGARRAYLVTPSSERAEAQQRRFADLAVQAGVGHLVVLSQLGAKEESPVRFLRYHAAVERHRHGTRRHRMDARVPARWPDRAVLVSSYLMSELGDVADHLVVVSRGRVTANASVREHCDCG